MKTLVAILALAGSSLVFAGSCPTHMKEIDAKLSTNPTVAAADMAQAKKLRADGEAFHKAGKHADSEKALGDSKKLLGI